MSKAIGALVLLVPLAAWSQAVDEKGAEEALAKFREGYKGAASDRASAVATLAQTQHDKTLSKLGNILMGDPEASVRCAAAKGIGTWKESKNKAAATLVNGLAANVRVTEVQVEIFKALGDLEDPVAAPTAHFTFKDKDVKVAKAAIECTGEIRSRDSIKPLVDYLENMERKRDSGGGGAGVGGFGGLPGGAGGGDDPQTRRAKELIPALNKALQSITLERYSNPKDWEVWWKRNEATFKVPPKPEPAADKKKKKK